MTIPTLSSLDLETCRFRPGLPLPPPVCVTVARGGRGWIAPTAELSACARDVLERVAAGSEWCGGANFAFDALVLWQWYPELRKLIDQCWRVRGFFDLCRFERMLQIQSGQTRADNRLGALSLRYGGPALNKDDGTQTSYGPLWMQPLSAYSYNQIHYATHDTLAGEIVFKRQVERAMRLGLPLGVVQQESEDTRWQNIIPSYGMRVDCESFEALAERALRRLGELSELATEQGFLHADGSQDQDAIRRAVTEAYEGNPPMTEPKRDRGRKQAELVDKWRTELARASAAGDDKRARAAARYLANAQKDFTARVSIAKTVLIDSGNPQLEDLAEWGSARALVNKDLRMLRAGTVWPIRSKVEIADTTRVIYSKPNMMNFGRDGGVRETVHPREGHTLGSWDIGGMELGTLAQVIYWVLGDSRMADEINSGVDLHVKIAALMLEIEYAAAEAGYKAGDYECDSARGTGKVANFGLSGGMSEETFVWFAKQSYGIRLTLEQSRRICAAWRAARPEVVEYLKWVRRTKRSRATGRYDFEIPMSGGLIRANATYCSACNGHFQGLGAQLAKAIARAVIPRTFDIGDPIHGVRFCNFVHDELLADIPLSMVETAVPAVERVFEAGFRAYCPDVRLTTDGVIMRYWSKAAKPRYNLPAPPKDAPAAAKAEWVTRRRRVQWPVWTDVVDLAFKAGGDRPKREQPGYDERAAARKAAVAATARGGELVLPELAPGFDATAAMGVLQRHANRYGITLETPFGLDAPVAA